MNSIINFFEYCSNLTDHLVDFLITIFDDIVLVVSLLGMFFTNIPTYFSWLPAECVTLIAVVFSVVIVLRVSGR